METMEECMMMLIDAGVQKFYDSKVNYFIESVNREEALENQNFVPVEGEDNITSFCCNGISIENEKILHNDMLQEILAIELLNDNLVLEQETPYNAEESMEKENVQQTDVCGVQLETNGKKEIEKLWKMKLDEKKDSKKEKLTT